MPRFTFTIEYDGTPYYGWQRQQDVSSVQEAIESAITKFCQQDCTLHCSGRTDAGVHAYGQIAHADIDTALSCFTIQQALNHYLMDERISILHVEQVDDAFHARFDAKQRYYEYHIINRRAPCVIEHQRVWHVPKPLNLDAMREAAMHLIGTHDFSSFRDSDCQAKSPIKTLESLELDQQGERIILRLNSLSFLHHQVRIIAGTLVDIGKGKHAPDDIPTMLSAKERAAAGVTAPAFGLYFVRVEY